MRQGRGFPLRERVLLPSEERRRGQRVLIRMPVTLHFNEKGHADSVGAHTISVNDHGALVICRRSFALHASLELELKRTGERQRCKVVRAPAESPDGFCVPVEFEAPAKGFWQISFPPVDPKSSSS